MFRKKITIITQNPECLIILTTIKSKSKKNFNSEETKKFRKMNPLPEADDERSNELLEAKLALSLNFADPSIRGNHLADILKESSLNKSQFLILSEVVQTSLTEYHQDQTKLAYFTYAAVLPIMVLGIHGPRMGIQMFR